MNIFAENLAIFGKLACLRIFEGLARIQLLQAKSLPNSGSAGSLHVALAECYYSACARQTDNTVDPIKQV